MIVVGLTDASTYVYCSSSRLTSASDYQRWGSIMRLACKRCSVLSQCSLK